MSIFNPNKLSVSYKNNVPIKKYELPRKYTLTHSDITGELFLTIGKYYDYEKVGPLRDEVLAEWRKEGVNDVLEANITVDGDGSLIQTVIRDSIFRKELPLALTAIVYGDGMLIEANKDLNNSKVIIKFNSSFPEYNVTEEWGIVQDYKYYNERQENIEKGFYPKPYPMPKPYPNPYPYPPIPPVIPIPIPQPYPPYNQPGKCRIVEDALIAMLNPYIENQVNILFGRKTPYCLKNAEIIEAKVAQNYSPCTQEYVVTVGVRVGKNPPPYSNLIMQFIINENLVKVVDVKTPRDRKKK